MADLLHPATAIPGGLWVTAPARGTMPDGREYTGVVSEVYDGGARLAVADNHHIEWQVRAARLSLLLPGPLGLGAAGLRVRCAEALGWELEPGEVPTWERDGPDHDPAWALASVCRIARINSDDVPTLAAIDPADPLADLRALGRLAAHLTGATT